MKIYYVILIMMLLGCNVPLRMMDDAPADWTTMKREIEIKGGQQDLFLKASEWFIKSHTIESTILNDNIKEGKFKSEFISNIYLSKYYYDTKTQLEIKTRKDKVVMVFSGPEFKPVGTWADKNFIKGKSYKKLTQKNGLELLRAIWIKEEQSLKAYLSY
ncbi:MAG: hypothetical protein V3V14_08555 [Saprospiraceae bacterium]